MPLKHHTETALVLLLALMIALTGIALSWVPPFPEGVVGWLILLIATGAYPLVLGPMLRDNRADYEFRWLHTFPLLMVVVWALVHVVILFTSSFAVVATAFAFLWGLPAVTLGFLLLIMFCNVVIRRSHVRIRMLTMLFGIFLVGGIWAHMQDLNDTVRAALFDDTILTDNVVVSMFREDEAGTGAAIAMDDDTKQKQNKDVKNDTKGMKSAASRSSSSRKSGVTGKQVQKIPDAAPPKLPKSGGEAGMAVFAFIALYCGVLHVRAKERL